MKNFCFCSKIKRFSLIFLILSGINFTLGAETEITTISIKNARSTEYKQSEQTGDDVIVFEGNVELSVQKNDSLSEIKADKITYDRQTEMLYAQGNVEISTKTGDSGSETSTASSFLMNTSTLEGIFDNGKVVQTQSDALNLPSGSTLIVFADIFGKGASNTIAFKNSQLTFCDDENPHWHIDATRTWLLPGGEFAFLNAVLFVGVVPVMYFPAFYYPKDEFVFNPVFGYRKREGYFIQNTIYLLGRKPLDSSSSSSSTSSSSSSNSDTADNTSAESLKSLYNFMKPSSLKEQQLEGIVLHNLDSDYSGDTSTYVKLLADYYSTLGWLAGAEGNLKPNDFISKLNFSASLGFSNTIFLDSSGNYVPYNPSTGTGYKESSSFLGVDLPFRFDENFEISISKPFSLTLSLPLYSDPYYKYDYKTNRSESMDWISYALSQAQENTETVSVSEVSSFNWLLTSSYSPVLPDFMKPYVSSVSFSSSSAVNFSSMNTTFSYTDKDEDGNSKTVYTYEEAEYDSSWSSYTSQKKFYYPSQITPLTANISLSGTLFKWPLDSKKSSKTEPEFAVTMNKPFDLKTKKEIEEENTVDDSDSSKNKKEEADDTSEEAENIMDVVTLPDLDFSVPVLTESAGLTYTLGYSLGANISSQISYASSPLKKSSDFDWQNMKSYMYTIKTPVKLTSNLNYGGSFLGISSQFSFDPVFQKHPYLQVMERESDETLTEYSSRTTESGSYTQSSANSVIVSDYKAESRDISDVNSISFKPFYYLDHFKNTSFSWNNTVKLFRQTFIGDADNPQWQYYGLDWEDDSCVTTNTLNAVLAASEFSDKLAQSITLTAVMPPLLKQYSAALNLTFPYVTASLSTGFQEKSKNISEDSSVEEKDKWKKNPLNESVSVSLFNSKLSFTQSYTYNLEDDNPDALKFAVSWNGLQASYAMSYTYGYDFDTEEGWIVRKEKEFLPYSLTFSYAPSTKTFYSWYNRISIAPGLNTSLTADLIRPTNSNFIFTPSLTFKINEFLNVTFSSTSKNQVLYRYFQTALGYDGRIPGEQNMFIDLINSFRFDNENLRKNSGFKLKTIDVAITHELHDWKFIFNYKMTPQLKTDSTRPYYDFNPYIVLAVSWNPMESMKTQVKDKYGEWQFY